MSSSRALHRLNGYQRLKSQNNQRRFAPITMRRSRRSRWRDLADHDARNTQSSAHNDPLPAGAAEVTKKVGSPALRVGSSMRSLVQQRKIIAIRAAAL